MTPPGDRRSAGSPEDWLAHAKSDLSLARLARDREGVLPEHVCFHAQQAVEKSLKAVLLFRQIEFPLIHDVEELLELAEQGGVALPPEVADSSALTPYAVEARYPGHWENITPKDVDEAIRAAERVVAWAAAMIASQGKSA